MREKLIKFMQGRYGPDELYKAFFILYIVILIINLFFQSIILEVINLVLVFIIFYRFFSKNITAREKERNLYLKFKRKIFTKNKSKDSVFIYKRCKKCHQLMKLPIPYKRGVKTVKCPKCAYKNKFIILKKQKVEIIKK